MRQLKFHWGYLQAALALVALAYLASLWLFPGWNQLVGLLVVLVAAGAAGAFTFVVSLRQDLDHLQAAGDHLPGVIAAMQGCVDYQREIGHPNAAAGAAEVEQLRARLAAQTR